MFECQNLTDLPRPFLQVAIIFYFFASSKQAINLVEDQFALEIDGLLDKRFGTNLPELKELPHRSTLASK